ncbi:phosphatidate cytidylyltransferase [Schleiferia thermophila]|jgi:phosphatidate cytidylyltransferase|uniref:Phosphatidate cytidylyltransferase n=1 Tax=Schleiferia thermophila TaxID=884107 RepID=A0A369A2D3_9FLAO|nr:phosphatidate cytidylyltransferase [Schleiferia thermophila]KFD39159.1 phosphatidate cytidylyltransferase [Schleiferia thermophila str. Yellowstone]RCX03351.1 phosphatidate cytidylyltransferase [Schleiferia thermophila]GCD80480.1 phosphatidate cytidylyltransferase [Schleiferia thermophila]
MKEFFLRSTYGLLYVLVILIFTYYNLSPILLYGMGILALGELKILLHQSSRQYKLWNWIFFLSILPWISTVLLNTLFYDPMNPGLYVSVLNRLQIDFLVKNFFEWRWVWLSIFVVYVIVKFFRLGWYAILPFAYVMLPVIFALELDLVDESILLSPVLVIFMYMWVFDTFSYMVGKLIGRHPVAPSISPGKTWEGLSGGLLGVLGLSYLMFYKEIFPFENVSSVIMLGIAMGLAAFFGDLFESGLKRKAGVKDSGKLIPGHGGILDRIDSFLFASPAFFFSYLIIV